MAADSRKRDERERMRLYAARQELHTAGVRRRRRDDLIAGIAGGVIVLAAVGAQVAYFTAGPGTPAPVESGTPAPSVAPTP